MLGYWNKSVYITYLGAFVASCGFLFTLNTGNVDYSKINKKELDWTRQLSKN
jgi:hypothetical protein